MNCGKGTVSSLEFIGSRLELGLFCDQFDCGSDPVDMSTIKVTVNFQWHRIQTGVWKIFNKEILMLQT